LVRNSPALRACQREIFARFEQAAALADETGAPPTPSSRSSPPPGWSASSGSTSKAATATQNHPGNTPNASSTSSNAASATTPSRPPPHLPAEQKCRICVHHGRTVTRQSAAHIGGSARGYLAVGGPISSPGMAYWLVACSVYLYIAIFGANVRICRCADGDRGDG
jgi:hypothetical protein